MLYYKYFKNLFILPDAFFIVSPDGNKTPLNEVNRSGEIISIGLVDTDHSTKILPHYSLFSNDDSVLISYFFFNLFCNLYLLNYLSDLKSAFN